MAFSLERIQQSLKNEGLDGWLLYDFRGTNPLALRVLDKTHLATKTRRWVYFIPTQGEPTKLVHRIESGVLDSLPGVKRVYLKWSEWEAAIAAFCAPGRRVALEYSPSQRNPAISRVDPGLVDLARKGGAELVSSGDLLQQFESVWTEAQWDSHLEAALGVRSAFSVAFGAIREALKTRGEIRETEVQSRILKHFEAKGLTAAYPPTVACGPHAGDPHYSPHHSHDAVIRRGDLVLVDIWAKLKTPGAVYSDLTLMGFADESVPPVYAGLFDLICRARDAGIELVRTRMASGLGPMGWEVDDATRSVIEAAGQGEAFCHRTGHSIGQETHGNGANIDNLETREERRLIPGTCFSIEPGVYFEDFGLRTEVNVCIRPDHRVIVTGGPPQTAILPILSDWEVV